jgi:hypothetical protein
VVVVGSTGPGVASTRWNDYVGSVAADDAQVLGGGPSLYQLVGLDRDQWIVVGVDLVLKERIPELVVYAAANSPHGAGIDGLIDATGQLPVTAYSITDPTQVEKFFTEAFGQLSIRLRPRELSHPIHVVDRHTAHEPSAS